MGYNADPSRIALPRGRVFFARKNLTTGVLDAPVHLGNCPKLEFNTIGDDIDEVMDFTSFTAVPLTRISKKRAPEFSLTLMEASPDNLALVFMGNTPTDYSQTGGVISAEVLSGGLKIGAIFQLAQRGTTGTPIQLASIARVGGGATFVAGTHYVLRDSITGLVEILAIPSGAAVGDSLSATYTAPTIGSGVYKQVLGGTAARIEGKLLYVGASNVGPVHSLEIWNCSLESDGGFPFIATDHVEFPVKVTVLSDAAHTELFRLLELEAS